jgi:hypothetical protein
VKDRLESAKKAMLGFEKQYKDSLKESYAQIFDASRFQLLANV